MKKVTLLLTAVAFTLCLASCSKDYTCTCKYNNGTSDTTQVVLYPDAKKSDAEDACTATQLTLLIIDASASCNID